MRVRLPRRSNLLGLFLVLAVVHPLLSLYRWVPGSRYYLLLFPTLELAGVIVAAAASGLLPTPWRRALRGAAAFALIMGILFSVGEAFYLYVYRQAFVPWTDLSFVPAFLNMLLASDLFGVPAVMAGISIVVLFLAFLPALLGVRAIARALGESARTRLVGAAVVVVFAVVGAIVDGTSLLTVRMVAQIRPPEPTLSAAVALPVAASTDDRRFPVLGEEDIHLLIVESYGHTLFSRDDHYRAILPSYRRTETALSQAGYQVYSKFLESPVFGGRSWLADATLLTGLFLDTQAKYEEAVRRNRNNLTHVLGDAGFTRILAAPGTYFTEEDWRQFYRYDHYLLRYDFGYQGPFVSFGTMPDQFLLHKTVEFAQGVDDGAPQFVTYVMVSSHVPFAVIPPYLPEWDDLGDGTVFSNAPMKEFDNSWWTGGDYSEGYVASIDYVLQTITGFLVERLPGSPLVVVVGDHQPRIPIAEQEATYSVPIHVVSKDPEKVRPFRNYGFTAGLVPVQRGEHPGMDRFFPMLMEVIQGNAHLHGIWRRNVVR